MPPHGAEALVRSRGHAEQPAERVCGRLAPSPTGYAHLGNAWAFLLAWLAVRARKGVLILRLEDIDPQRSRPEFATALLEDLRWLGLDWDQGPDAGGPVGPYEQSRRGALYEDALARLEASGLTYSCFCTRKELRLLAAAPHVDDAGAPYPGTCRELSAKQRESLLRAGRKAAVRLRSAEERVDFVDALLGPQSFCLAECGGDFALRRSDGVVAYQLAVAVDDALMGVNQVVRGRDILSSTPRQIVLLRLLGHAVPSYAHIPLLLDGEGQRLAKRHQSLSLRSMREQGADPRRIAGLLARLAGLNPRGWPVRPAELLPDFALERLPGADQRVTDQDLRQLAS